MIFDTNQISYLTVGLMVSIPLFENFVNSLNLVKTTSC